jgi:sugar phosphate isomerase/epimerase
LLSSTAFLPFSFPVMFALSTCWNSDAIIDGEEMINQIRSLGFSRIELSHGIRLSLFEGIERALKKDPTLQITSLHNFCPLPVGYLRSAPNVYLLSAERTSERQRAIKQTINTLDFAVKTKALYVVLHLGSVPMENYTKELLKLISNGQRETPKYEKLLQKAKVKRVEKGKRPFDRMMTSLETIVTEARQRNIMLGIENRHDIDEIPNEIEMKEILKTFDPKVVGYWHDTGHAETWHHLGVADHVDWMQKFQDRLIGCHFHDVIYPDKDHQIPGDGTIPFDQLAILRRPDILKVFEFSPRMKAETLKVRLPKFMAEFEVAE